MSENINQFKTTTIADRMPYGVYVWRMDDGRYVGDDEGHYLCISALRGDTSKKLELEKAVRYYGIHGGQAEWKEGQRKVTDEEYEHQKQRMEWGLTPDPMDVSPEVDELIRRGHND